MAQKTSLVRWVLGLAIALGASWSSAASAQITLDRYVPAPLAQDGFIITRPQHTGHMNFGALLYMVYANDPVVWETRRGDDAAGVYSLVKDQFVVQPSLSLGLFDRWLVFAQMPVNLVVSGDNRARAATGVAYDESGSIGELKLGGRYLIYDEPHGPFAFGVQAGIGLPTAAIFGAPGVFGAEDTVTGFGQVLGEFRLGHARINLNLGVRFRQETTIANLHVDDEFVGAIGMSYPLVRHSETRLEGFIEGFGSTLFDNVGGREATPIESLAGVKLFTKSGMTGGVAADLGLTAGYGAPSFRLIAMVGYAPMVTQEGEEEQDSDADGLVDSLDKCPTEPDDDLQNPKRDGCPRRDSDGDGLIEPADKCPKEAEDKDSYQDDDGCPDGDNDSDGIPDASDQCPLEAEDKDGFQDEDGCPDPDNDNDGILDANDKCPTEAEDKDGFQDEDGCPDPDNDGDGVLDAVDQCPLEPESRDGKDDEDGCPDLARLDMNNAQIVTMQPIRFETNRTTILPESLIALEQVASVMRSHPEIGLVSVEGHTDSAGNAGKNQKLSTGRAAAVREYLITQGIGAERLISEGFGSTVPIADNATPDGRSKNRRVEFNIVPQAAAPQ